MRRSLLLVSAAALLPSPIIAQTAPESVHIDANGPSDLCGVIGENALAIRAKLKSDANIAEEPSGSPRFETYFSSVETKQWTVTTKRDPAYPTVTCVHLYNSHGATEMKRDMRCDASREACDTLFREFDASDTALRKQIRGG